MAANSVEPHALYDIILAFESSWSEWSDIPGLEKEVNKDLTTLHSEELIGKLTGFILHVVLCKDVKGKRNNINIYKHYKEIWKLIFFQLLLSSEFFFWVFAQVCCHTFSLLQSFPFFFQNNEFELQCWKYKWRQQR